MIDTKKRYPTKKEGVFYRLNKDNDKVFYFGFKTKSGKRIEKKVGAYLDGTRESHCVEARVEAIRRDMIDTMLPEDAIQRTESTLDEVAEKHFYDIKKKNKNKDKDIGKYNKYIGYIQRFVDEKIAEYNEQLNTETSKSNIGSIKYQIELLTSKSNSSLIGNTPVSELQERHLNKLLEKCEQEKLQTKSIQVIFSILNSILTTAKVKNNPITKEWRESNIEKTNNESERYLDDNEVQLLLDTTKNNTTLHTFILLGLYTGARASAILELRRVDIQENTIKINDHKKGKKSEGDRYSVPLKQSLKEALKLDELVSGDYLVGRSRTPVPYDMINQQSRKVFDELFNKGLDFKKDRKHWVSAHTLRHTFASRLAKLGCSIYSIKKLLNHSDIKMTMRYSHLSPDNGKEYLERML